jgi:RNA-directed DNA polymerase
MLDRGVVRTPVSGTPQGSPFSPLLANIALHVLDERWVAECASLGVLVRYCDDFVILPCVPVKVGSRRPTGESR